MGDVSVIARRLEGGKRVQYGWSGNSGYFRVVGSRLLRWYDNPEKVEYLFGLGQMELIGKPGSENGGEPIVYSNIPDGSPHWLGKSEREIFSQIAFIDYGYFYDLDNTWYYIIPGPFRIKIPLAYIEEHVNERGSEFEELEKIELKVSEFILGEYYSSDDDLKAVVNKEYPEGIEEIRESVLSANEGPCEKIWKKYKAIYEHLDDWVVVKTTPDLIGISDILVRRNQETLGEARIETIDWDR